MPAPLRVTRPQLDILEVLVRALDRGEDLHGWLITKAAKRPGPTVYTVLHRLEKAGWVTGEWEAGNPVPGTPRRRLYRLTPPGVSGVTRLLDSTRALPDQERTTRLRIAIALHNASSAIATAAQDEGGAWRAQVVLAPGLAAFGNGPTEESAMENCAGELSLLLEELRAQDGKG